MSCGVGPRHGLDPALLWRRSAATALIRLLAWEPPYATGIGLKRQKKKKKKKKEVIEANLQLASLLQIVVPEVYSVLEPSSSKRMQRHEHKLRHESHVYLK